MQVTLKSAMRRVVALTATTLLASAHSVAEEPVTQRKIHLVLQDFARNSCTNCGAVAPLVMRFSDRQYARGLVEQFKLFQLALPQVDIANEYRRAFCRELAGSDSGDCDQVSIYEPDSDKPGTFAVGPEGAILVVAAINFETVPGPNPFRAFAAIADPRPNGPGKLLAEIWYVSMPPSQFGDTPLDPSEAGGKKLAASRDYWLSGTPSRLEVEVRRAISDVAGLTKLAIQNFGPDAPAGTAKAWVSSLPLVESLRSTGRVQCRLGVCDLPLLNVTEHRYWALSWSSVPLLSSGELK